MDTIKEEHTADFNKTQSGEVKNTAVAQPLPELEQAERKQDEQGLKAEKKDGLLGEMQRAMPTAEGMRELEEAKRARQNEQQQSSSEKTAKDG